MFVDLEILKQEIENKISARLTTEANTRTYVFPDGDFNKTGKPFVRNTCVVSLANQSWSGISGPAALSRGMSLAQESNIDLSFYLFGASLVGNGSLFQMYKILIEELAGTEFTIVDRKLGPLYPVSFSYRDLSESCIWAYECLMTTSFLDGGKKSDFNTPITLG